MTLERTTVAAANAVTARAASDHGFPLVWLHNIALVDVRRKFLANYRQRDRSLVRFVSIHHDAVFYPDDPDPADDFWTEMGRLNAVDAHHRGQGWPGIGYHTYGFPSGRLYLVGDFDTQRANVALRNHESIGHCIAGDFSGRMPPIASQLVAGMAVLAAWKHLGRLVEILPHRIAALRTAPTQCPGDSYIQWMPHLNRAIEAIARQRAER
jgi:hypothetical protein